MSRALTESKLFHGYFSTTTPILAFLAPFSLSITKVELLRHAAHVTDENVYFEVHRDGTEITSTLWQIPGDARRHLIATSLPIYMQSGDALYITMDGGSTPLDPSVSVSLEYDNV